MPLPITGNDHFPSREEKGRDMLARHAYPLRVQKASRNPALEDGAFDARDIADRVRRAWEKRDDLPAKQVVARLGLASESAWSKRIYPDKRGWVPFRADELSIIAPLLFPGAPWRLFFDETVSGVFGAALAEKAIRPPATWGSSPPERPPPPSASSEHQAGPRRRRGRGTG
jgi:hypothetical protein